MYFKIILLFVLVLCFSFGCVAPSGPIDANNQIKVDPSEMVLIPKGPFYIGSSEKDIDWIVETFYAESRDWYLDETPSQAFYLNQFFIDKYEVTVEKYKNFIQKTRRTKPKFLENPKHNGPNHPIVGVTWQDAADYCAWVSKRLPTEAEWEKAARGDDGRRYPWGNNAAIKKANVRGTEDSFRYSSPVGNFPEGQSPYGVMDMAGNAFEWTQDWYKPFPGNEGRDDLYNQKLKVVKGGSWKANMDLARSALRGKRFPHQSADHVGFRCAKNADKTASLN
jgi:formylglycine-generating enzyme required for sulfatase activity